MAAAKPDMTHLEALVGQGRHAEALDGYLKLLTNRPTDPLLRARVEMLREALAQEADQFIPAGDTDPKSTYVVTPEEVADSYVLAGRYDDAILILEKILVQRPADRQVMDRLDRVKKLKTSGASDGAESTTPQQEFVAPPHTPSKPLGRPAAAAPAFGQPKSGVGKAAQQSHASGGRSPGSAMHRPVVDKPAAAGPVEMVRVNSAALAAAPAFGTPRSLGGARRPARETDPVGAAVQSLANRKDTAPTTPVVTDDPSSTGDRTVLSPPPQPLRKAQVLVDPTRVSAPPDRLLRASKTEPSTDPLPPQPDFTTTSGLPAQLEELTRPAIGLPAGMADDDDDNARTAASDAPEGLAEALAVPEGSATRLVPLPVVHDERTWASPPPVHEPDPPGRKPVPSRDKPRKR